MKVSARQYAHALLAATEDGSVAPTVATASLLARLQRTHKLRLLPAIMKALDVLRNTATNTVPVRLTTARPVATESIQTSLHAHLKATITLDHQIDPTLLGGAVVTIGDTRIDASVAGSLARLRRSLRSGR